MQRDGDKRDSRDQTEEWGGADRQKAQQGHGRMGGFAA